MRIKELKFLHKKKEMLNRELYRRHLQVAQEWGRWWDVIHESILQKINTEMERKYKIMDDKIKKTYTEPSTQTKDRHKLLPKSSQQY